MGKEDRKETIQLRYTLWGKKRHNILTHIHHFLFQKYYLLNKNGSKESKAMIKISVFLSGGTKLVIFFIHTAWGQQTCCNWII